MTAQELGAVRKRISCSEKYAKQAPLWKDILPNFLLMLILGFMIGSLSVGAGLSDAAGWILGALVTVLFTAFCVLTTRSARKQLAGSFLELREKGVSGLMPLNAFRSGEYAYAFSDIKNVTVKKDRLILTTTKRPVSLFVEDAEALAAEIRSLCP